MKVTNCWMVTHLVLYTGKVVKTLRGAEAVYVVHTVNGGVLVNVLD